MIPPVGYLRAACVHCGRALKECPLLCYGWRWRNLTPAQREDELLELAHGLRSIPADTVVVELRTRSGRRRKTYVRAF